MTWVLSRPTADHTFFKKPEWRLSSQGTARERLEPKQTHCALWSTKLTSHTWFHVLLSGGVSKVSHSPRDSPAPPSMIADLFLFFPWVYCPSFQCCLLSEARESHLHWRREDTESHWGKPQLRWCPTSSRTSHDTTHYISECAELSHHRGAVQLPWPACGLCPLKFHLGNRGFGRQVFAKEMWYPQSCMARQWQNKCISTLLFSFFL